MKDLEEHLDRLYTVGIVNPDVLAASLLEHPINNVEYFNKRIIVIELYIGQLKKE